MFSLSDLKTIKAHLMKDKIVNVSDFLKKALIKSPPGVFPLYPYQQFD